VPTPLTAGSWPGGRCYDHNFLRFLPNFGEKMAFFLKTNVMVQMFQKLKPLWTKNANFFANFFRKNIFLNHNIGPWGRCYVIFWRFRRYPIKPKYFSKSHWSHWPLGPILFSHFGRNLRTKLFSTIWSNNLI
jgi:hypothetical protein